MWLERFIFNNRLAVLLVSLVATLFLGWHATQLPVNASFEKMIPGSHPYIQNFFKHKEALRGLGNSVRIVVETHATATSSTRTTCWRCRRSTTRST